jgi:hypothetical protein
MLMKSIFATTAAMMIASFVALAGDDEVVNALHMELSQAVDGAQRASTAANAYSKCAELEGRIQARTTRDDFWGRYLMISASRCKAIALGNGAPPSGASGACAEASGAAKKLTSLAAFAAAKPDAVPAQIRDVDLFLKDQFTYVVNIGRKLKCAEDIESMRPKNAR